MKMIKDLQKQLHNKKSRVIVGFTLSLVLFCLAGGVWYGKFYAGRSNKGVTVASSLYFQSNFLKNVQGKGNNEYPAVYNTNIWSGTSPYEFQLQIRNYQNQLLYNDENMDIQYKISFQLMGATDGGTYQVTYGGETKDITFESASEFEVTLDGGQARADQFKVAVSRPSDNTDVTYRSVGVRVTAIPISPSYVANYETLGGILYASLSSSEYVLKGEFSKLDQENLNKYVSFPFTITYKPGMDIKAVDVKISWDAGQLQLDKYSSYYKLVKSDNTNNKEYINLSVKPYATFDMVFYRKSEFTATTIDELNQLVSIEKVEEETE